MKRKLLLSAAVCATLSVFPQATAIKPSATGKENVKALTKIEMNEAAASNNQVAGPKVNQAAAPSENGSAMKTSAVNTWTNITTSTNILSVIIPYCKPLQYNDELNAVSFIHRRPPTYVASPVPAATAASGLILALVSPNMGNTWDSTLLWNDNTNWGRYPGGGIYNPPGNTTLSAAYVVGIGPTTSAAGGWPGNFFASKSLATYNNVASTAPGAQQWMDILNPNPNVGRNDFAAYGFTSTDDGKIRGLAGVTDDGTGSDTAVMMITGTFNSGVFAYSGTVFRLVPITTMASDGSYNMLSRPMQAWNEAGTVGYVGVLGVRQNATGSNEGIQPIVWKTTNSGASWALIPGIDFNNSAYNPIKRSIATISTNTAVEVPWFSWLEGMDMVVDANNKLHYFSSLYGAASNHPDSAFYLGSYGTEGYRWPHTPGYRPYLYDFMTDGSSAWTYKTVDSMSTEGPAGVSTGNGFNDNPWDLNGSDKSRIDARIHMSRTPNGKFIYYTWAESDTNFTSSAKKWNVLPNAKVRAYSVDLNLVSTNEVNVTSPSSGPVNPNVASRAMYHFMGSKTSSATVVVVSPTLTTAEAKIPFTVSNNPGYNQLQSITHWYNTAQITFSFSPIIDAINESAMNSANTSVLYPNPASNNATLLIDLKGNEKVELTVLNLIGQSVKAYTAEGQMGENQINLDLNGLKTGVYMVNVKVGNANSTKKLIIE